MKPQGRDPHTYMLASPVRVADVFVPGTFSTSVGSPSAAVSGEGVWRTVILFGRGIGGKYYTALDVTGRGAFTTMSLATAPPIPLWSRGNPDTQNGTAAGTKNNTFSSQAGTYDFDAYATLGQTWAAPAIAFVSAATSTTLRTSGGVEFVAYTGGGYGSGPNATAEGTTLLALDMVTGDVTDFVDIGSRSGMSYANALVASPSSFNAELLSPGFVGHPAGSLTTRVYFPDIHGRLHRILTASAGSAITFADFGADQPIGNPVALLNYAGTQSTARPHVFVESGNDNRVTPPPAATPPFHMWGLRDEDLGGDPNTADSVGGPARVLFDIEFPSPFRGTVQPATAFNGAQEGRVFFAGNRFNLPGTANAPTPPPCVSSFDAILFAVGAESGAAAYDLPGGRSLTQTGQRIQAVRVEGGGLVVDTGLGAGAAPSPPPPPTPVAGAPPTDSNILFGPQPSSALAQQPPITYRLGSGVCR
jgi:hypothetical protein